MLAIPSNSRSTSRALPAASVLNASVLPDSVQEVVTSRIDRLTPTQQLTIKIASVIGRSFGYRILYDTFPVEDDRVESVRDDLVEVIRPLRRAARTRQEDRAKRAVLGPSESFFFRIARRVP